MTIRSRLADTLKAFSEQPAAFWPAGLVHHGVRLLLLLGLAVMVHLLFPVAPALDLPTLERGVVADQDVIARSAFNIYKSDADLARERGAAAAAVSPVFRYDPSSVDSMDQRVSAFFDWINSYARAAEREADLRAAIFDLLESYGWPPVDSAVVDALVSPAERALLRRALENAISTELRAGVVSGAATEEMTAEHVRVLREDEEEIVPRNTIITLNQFLELAARQVPADARREVRDLQRLMLIRFFEPSMRLERAMTDDAREEAQAQVSAVKEEVLKDQRIVSAHEVVTERELERLAAYRAHLRMAQELAPGASRRSAGALLFNLFVLGTLGLLLFFYRPAIYLDFRQVLVLAFLTTVVLGFAAIIARTGSAVELIPLAFVAMLVAGLWDGRFAVNMALILAVLLAGQTPFLGITVLFTGMMGGAAAAFGLRVAQSRERYWVLILIIAFAYLAAAVTLGLLRTWELSEIMVSAGWGGVNALGSTLVAMGALPLFESFTRITTDQTLLELTNQSRPLLRRLAAEAPGTFVHSISMANLAEAAAREVGANPLLTRAGSYYHDIGKLARPQYFIENQPPGRNPHDKLKPANSVAILREHVLEGLRLAEKAKLPGCVKAFIAEHHGTQLISFFFNRAQELAPDSHINPSDFVYPGPKPRSRETGIALLADSVESAARVLQDPTPERIEALVNRIVDDKVDTGQLDDTPLTLGEVKRIKEQFVAALASMYHQRIDYPPSGLAASR